MNHPAQISFTAVFAVLVTGAVGGAQACGNATGVAAGGACITAIDCATGLICLPKTHVCSSNLTSVTTELDSGSLDAAAAAKDAPAPTGDTGAMMAADTGAGTGSGSGGCNGTLLTVNNIISWCTVTVGSNAPSTAATQTVCVAGSSVSISATPINGFQLWSGMWESGTTSMAGTVAGGTSTATANLSGATGCVTVCCEQATASPTDCDNTNACP
jgi:hypothetical protein